MNEIEQQVLDKYQIWKLRIERSGIGDQKG